MEQFDLKKFLIENKLTTNSKSLKKEGAYDKGEELEEGSVFDYNEKGMIKSFKPNAVKLGPYPEDGEMKMIPLDFIGFRKNEGYERGNGSFPVTVFAKRSDSKKWAGLEKFEILAFVTKDLEDANDTIRFPNEDAEYKRYKLDRKEDLFKYIKDNLSR